VSATFSYRDGGLHSRPLRIVNAIGRGLAPLGLKPSLAPASIVAAARKAAGSDDLGGESYREPLEQYVASAEREAELTTFGRVAVRRMLTGSLATRIRLHGWAQEHPELREERIVVPWVIVGLPRTGTTLLSYLLGLDPMARAPLHWEAAHLVPPPTLATHGEDPRIAETAKQLEGLRAINPAVAAMHPMGATLAQECVAFFMLDLRTLGVETQALVPAYGRWLEACDMRPAYAWHRLCLQTLQAAQPTERWILKTPNHLWALDALCETYPDARIVWTHREPADVVTSLASLTNTLQRMSTDRRDPRPAAEEWKHKVHHALGRGMAFDDARGDGWCFHLRYPDLVADPVGAVRRLYASFGEDLSPLHERRMQAWLRDRPQQAFGRHVYDPADYGWTRDGLADEFGSYAKRYDVA
jgi:hypothetical protein